jgi:hypothetical protein
MADLPVTEQRVQVSYLKRELETGITMANLAITEWSLGETEAAKRAEQYAKRAYADFMRFLKVRSLTILRLINR